MSAQATTPYPLIDTDPHFSRVVRYFRGSDYAVWAGSAAAFPTLQYLWELAERTHKPQARALKVGGMIGFMGGFLLAYQNSSARFLGLRENEREVKKDLKELTQLAKEGKPLYGESYQPDYVQAAAARHSTNSQFKLAAIPWFNMVNHPYHGVDTRKYYEAAGVPVPTPKSDE